MPSFYFFIGHVKTSGSKTTYEMKNNAEYDLHALVFEGNSVNYKSIKTFFFNYHGLS